MEELAADLEIESGLGHRIVREARALLATPAMSGIRGCPLT